MVAARASSLSICANFSSNNLTTIPSFQPADRATLEELEIVLISLLLQQEHRKNPLVALLVSPIHIFNYCRTAKSELPTQDREVAFRNERLNQNRLS